MRKLFLATAAVLWASSNAMADYGGGFALNMPRPQHLAPFHAIHRWEHARFGRRSILLGAHAPVYSAG
jgi:hypothetical protein